MFSVSLPLDSSLNNVFGRSYHQSLSCTPHDAKNIHQDQQRQYHRSWSTAYETKHDIDEMRMDSDEQLDTQAEYLFESSSQTFDDVNLLDLFTVDHSLYSNHTNLQLWQFLIELLMNQKYVNIIRWTGDNEYEFVILSPEQVAKLWAMYKNMPNMSFEKFSRGLRYYYNKKILKKSVGKRLTYCFQINIDKYLRQ